MLYTLNLYRAVHNSISIKLQEKSKQHGHQFNKDIFKDGKESSFFVKKNNGFYFFMAVPLCVFHSRGSRGYSLAAARWLLIVEAFPAVRCEPQGPRRS